MKPKHKRDSWGILLDTVIPINKIKEEVLKYYDQWLIDTKRQRNEIAHEHTFSYNLRYSDAGANIDKEIISKNTNSLLDNDANKELQNIFKYLEDTFDGIVVRADLVNMNPNSRIRMHKDRSDLLYIARRFHVPIKTNKDVIFTVNDQSVNMLEGYVYEINNSKYHRVINDGNENRIHLIIDLIPADYADRVVLID